MIIQIFFGYHTAYNPRIGEIQLSGKGNTTGMVGVKRRAT